MPLNLDTPLSLYSIPFAWAMAFYPHNTKVRLLRSTSGLGYDNSKPRAFDEQAMGKRGIPQSTIDKIARLTGAHQNGNEIFPVWAAAVLTANYAGIDQRTLNIISGAFIGVRLLYNYIYINQSSMAVSFVRSFTWLSSISLPMYLLIKAANKVRVA